MEGHNFLECTSFANWTAYEKSSLILTKKPQETPRPFFFWVHDWIPSKIEHNILNVSSRSFFHYILIKNKLNPHTDICRKEHADPSQEVDYHDTDNGSGFFIKITC